MSKIPDGLKCEITPEQVYENVPSIPNGYECIGFDALDHPAGCWALDERGGRILAQDLIIPRIIVRRKPEPHVYRGTNSQIFVCEQCERPGDDPIHINPAKPRRWLVEFECEDRPDWFEVFGWTGKGTASVKFQGSYVREVKPITREQVDRALLNASQPSRTISFLCGFLRELGIEVEE